MQISRDAFAEFQRSLADRLQLVLQLSEQCRTLTAEERTKPAPLHAVTGESLGPDFEHYRTNYLREAIRSALALVESNSGPVSKYPGFEATWEDVKTELQFMSWVLDPAKNEIVWKPGSVPRKSDALDAIHSEHPLSDEQLKMRKDLGTRWIEYARKWEVAERIIGQFVVLLESGELVFTETPSAPSSTCSAKAISDVKPTADDEVDEQGMGMRPSVLRAWQQYNAAVDRRPDLEYRTNDEVYAAVKLLHDSTEDGPLAKLDTWKRYVRQARELTGPNTPKTPREPGRSIVRREDT